MSDVEGFDEFEKYIKAFSAKLSPSELSKKNRKIAQNLREENKKRISANITPEGSAMIPRKNKKEAWQPSTKAKFLYPSGGGGKPRLVLLNKWTIKGGTIEGFDEKKGALRKFTRSKIIRWLPSEERAGKFKDPKAKYKTGKMFKKIWRNSYLQTKSNGEGLKVGFYSGKATALAPKHHYGQENLPSRPLLGITDKDIETILMVYVDGLE